MYKYYLLHPENYNEIIADNFGEALTIAQSLTFLSASNIREWLLSEDELYSMDEISKEFEKLLEDVQHENL